MATPTLDLNLDALRAVEAEAQDKHFRFQLGGQTFEFPPSLPLDVLGPMLPQIPAIIDLLKPILDESVTPGEDLNLDELDIGKSIEMLIKNPMLPVNVVNAVIASAGKLFDTQWADFISKRPTFTEARVLFAEAWKFYGLSLGELSRSAGLSATDGGTSKATSKGGTASTPARSGGKRTTPKSKASVG